MAGEFKRVSTLKRLVDPNDPNPTNPTNFMYIPVIDQITFNDGDNGQKSSWRLNNTERSNRVTHTKKVRHQSGPASTPVFDDSNYLNVERIDIVGIKDADDGQVRRFRLNNNDPPPRLADGTGPGHLRTHVVRYTKDNNTDSGASPWVDVELIDLLVIKDRDDGQKSIFRLVNQGLNQETGEIALDRVGDSDDPFNPYRGTVNLDLPKAATGSERVDPPYRLDPFQNVVNVNWGTQLSKYVLVWSNYAILTSDGFGDPAPILFADTVNFWQVIDTDNGSIAATGTTATFGDHPNYVEDPNDPGSSHVDLNSNPTIGSVNVLGLVNAILDGQGNPCDPSGSAHVQSVKNGGTFVTVLFSGVAVFALFNLVTRGILSVLIDKNGNQVWTNNTGFPGSFGDKDYAPDTSGSGGGGPVYELFELVKDPLTIG